VSGPATTTVHPTAVVSPDAEILEGVTVGPYAVVEAGAIVGRLVTLDAHVVIKGCVVLGEECQVHAGAVIGGDPQDLSFDRSIPSEVHIGDRTILREHVTVHRATTPGGATRVGEDCLLMGSSHVAHDAVVGDHVVLCNSALVAGHVTIGDRAFISGNSVIHQFARVGRVVMLSGASGIGRDVGPFLTVAGRSDIVGINAVGMRRAGINAPARARVKDAYRRLFGVPTLDEGRELVRLLGSGFPEVQDILEFFSDSRRGFSRPPAGHTFAGA
jgi:UDP-N-acetylglucosamine acyltransferase